MEREGESHTLLMLLLLEREREKERGGIEEPCRTWCVVSRAVARYFMLENRQTELRAAAVGGMREAKRAGIDRGQSTTV